MFFSWKYLGLNGLTSKQEIENKNGGYYKILVY